MFWPEEVIACIRRRWLSPERWVPPDHIPWLLQKDVQHSHHFSHRLLQKECLLFVETIVRPAHLPLPCNQSLRFEKHVWLQRVIVSDVTTYSVIVTLKRVTDNVSFDQINDLSHNSCFAPGVVFVRPQGEPNIVNWNMQRRDDKMLC